jgi:tRNA dimethylallyltransferase
MNKLLVICGPTATGKTGLALHLAKVFNGELISADSRQVYKDMDIGTGKDLPKSAKFKKSLFSPPCYEIDGVKVWGYDLVSPKKDFSVAHYTKLAKKIIKNIWKNNELPILVGGTGLYIKAVIDGIPTANVPKNVDLRKNLRQRSTNELFEILAQLDPIKAASLNISDKKNPRRLIRAIEVAQWMIKPTSKIGKVDKLDLEKDNILFVGVKGTDGEIKKRVKKRVNKRLKQGIIKEIKNLLKKGVKWNHQAMDALGYKQFKQYFEGEKKLDEVKSDWIRDEVKYAKRQMTWFRKDKRITWFDVGKKDYEKKIEKLVGKWYKKV